MSTKSGDLRESLWWNWVMFWYVCVCHTKTTVKVRTTSTFIHLRGYYSDYCCGDSNDEDDGGLMWHLHSESSPDLEFSCLWNAPWSLRSTRPLSGEVVYSPDTVLGLFFPLSVTRCHSCAVFDDAWKHQLWYKRGIISTSHSMEDK